ncbi:MAG: DUF6597 domain-containing transcriptional factor [bacterium]
MFGHEFDGETPGQLYHIQAEGVYCQLLAPASELSNIVHYYWLLHIEYEKVSLKVIPDAAIDLVLSPELKNFSIIYLPAVKGFSIPLEGPIHYAGICFNAVSAMQLFSATLDELNELEPGLGTTTNLGLEKLVHSIQGVCEISHLGRLFDLHLTDICGPEKVNFDPSISEFFINSLEPHSISEVANRLGVSGRQLRRTTTSLIGLSPKKIQRILRLQSALHELFNNGGKPLSDSFYDDSHRIREVKQLTGMTPGKLRRLAEKYNQSK